MKLNKIFMAFAAVAMVGCSSEDLNDFSANQAIDESGLVQLDPNFVIGGFCEDDATTRTHWGVNGDGSVYNTFLPIFTEDATAGKNLGTQVGGLEKDAVGLCWLGQTPGGTDVYTNYMFYHFGWFKKDATDKKPVFDCDKLTNGVMYNEITLANDVKAKNEAKVTDFELPTTPINKSTWEIDYNSGIYKTDNKAIFGGKYVVYYPFNEKFQNIGTIPAVAETMFDPAPRTVDDPALAKATFRYSSPVDIDGGSQASGFTLKNLSTLVQLKLNSKEDGLSSKQVDQIVLYSAKEQLLKEVHLAADQIVAGKERADLYVSGESKGTKTIVANATPFNLAIKNEHQNVFITVLPTTVEDLVVLVHNSTDGTWAEIPFKNADLKTKKARVLEVDLYNSSFKAKYIAVDEASLLKARNEARSALGGTIKVIGDITLKKANSPYDFKSDAYDTEITYEEGSIIVPEDVVLNAGTQIKSDVRVLGKSCCSGAYGGRLNIYGGTLNNVTMVPTEATVTAATYDDYNPAVTYEGNATIDANKTFDVQAGNVTVKAAVAHKGNINIAEGAKLLVKETGDLNFMGSKVVNDGTIEVEKVGKFDITDKDGNASATDGKNMTNNGKFIHNVDAAVGTAVQLMNQNGEYRCKVDKQVKLDDAYQKWTACSVIEMVDAGTNYNLGVAEKNINYKHNGKFIDIEVNTTSLTTFSNPVVKSGNGDSKKIQVGKLTVMQGGLNVEYVTGTGKRELIVNGDMTVSASSSLVSSKKITVKDNNLIVNNSAVLTYAGLKKNEGGLEVTKDITVSGATFNADDVNALDITCANFTLAKTATAKFGNRTDGDTKNLTVSGTIDNSDAASSFEIHAANQDGNGSVLATITCTKLLVGGAFPGGKPQVVAK